jgi:hypothetical protein
MRGGRAGRGGRGFGRGAAPLLALLAAGSLAACAKKAPPSGGPPDLTAPMLLTSIPDSGAAGVARDARLSVSFSEGMDPRATGDAVALAPRVEIKDRQWRRNTLTLSLAEPLEADQTYTLFVGTGARDRHGNVLVEGATVTFTTAATFPQGRLSGDLEARGMPAAGIYLWCYEAKPGRVPDSTARDFDALALADRDGHFSMPGLRVPASYRLWAFADLNNNRSFEPNIDVLAAIDTVLDLTDASPEAADLLISVVNPRAPAVVQGAVLDSLADSLGVLRVLAVSESDSTLRVMEPVTDDGNYEIKLQTGVWLIRAFRDLDKNRRWDPEKDPASEPTRLDLAPAAVVQQVDLVIRRPATASGP